MYDHPGSSASGFPGRVGQRRPNAWGLLDMHGNACEWCEDRYHESYGEPGRPDDGSPWTRGSTAKRVLRGGAVTSRAADACRSAARFGAYRQKRWADAGFRPAADLPE